MSNIEIPIGHKFAFANVSASSTAELVAAVAGKKIRVIKFLMITGDTKTAVTFKSGSTSISPDWQNGVNSGASAPGGDNLGWCETESGEALNVTAGSGSTVGVQVVYIEV